MLLTIYTPTYNRENLLNRLYSSLCKQTVSDFLWLVVDDGSTDGTNTLIESWKTERKIKIQYVYKKNGGVHTARDLAYEIVDSELIWGVDSDDWLEEHAVENVLNLWRSKGCSDYCGILAPHKFVNGSYSGKYVYPPLEAVSYQDLCYKYHCHGDQAIILRTFEIKKVARYPVFEDEKLVSEGFKWFQLPDKPFLLLTHFTTFMEYQCDGYTRNARRGYFKNLNGYYELHKIHVKCAKYFKIRLMFCGKFIITGLFLRKKNIVKDSPRPLMTLLLYPISLFVFIILKFKWNKFR